jgi:hypothetical protein
MKKELRSSIAFRIARNTLSASAFAFVSFVGMAQAQAVEIPTNAAKQTAPEGEIEKAAAGDNTKKEDAASIVGLPGVRPDRPMIARTGSADDRPGFGSGSTPTKPYNKSSFVSGWDFAFAPYLYMTGMKGTVGARGRTAEVDMNFSDVIENLNLALMGTFEARKGRFVVVNDLMWIKLGEERDTPGELFSSVKIGVNLLVLDPEAGYRVYQGERGSFDILGGVRLTSVETNINFREGALPASDVSERKTWATPVFGARGTLDLSTKFFLATKFDLGGGLGADFTGQFYGGGGYRITPGIALIGGYRYLKTDYDSDAGFLFDTEMNGIVIGGKFTF